MKTLLIQKRSTAQINSSLIYVGKHVHKMLSLSAFCNAKYKTSLVPVLFHVCATWLRFPTDGDSNHMEEMFSSHSHTSRRRMCMKSEYTKHVMHYGKIIAFRLPAWVANRRWMYVFYLVYTIINLLIPKAEVPNLCSRGALRAPRALPRGSAAAPGK